MIEKTEQAATMIANAILATPAANRALLLTHVAILLSRHGAPYTASLFKQLAVLYERENTEVSDRRGPADFASAAS
jgi:hypothetical protein